MYIYIPGIYIHLHLTIPELMFQIVVYGYHSTKDNVIQIEPNFLRYFHSKRTKFVPQ